MTAPSPPIPRKANEQHYEVPTEFFLKVLGDHSKYSCCYWGADTADLSTAESEALRITCEHAGLENGMSILELGCGWGALTLWMAMMYPDSRITAVSNSVTQREHITLMSRQQKLEIIEVITCDMNDFSTRSRFHRAVSVEMFEHKCVTTACWNTISAIARPGSCSSPSARYSCC